jgi:hypothetical protein
MGSIKPQFDEVGKISPASLIAYSLSLELYQFLKDL